jgi:FKBP12-rapamycin complex-associated protein
MQRNSLQPSVVNDPILRNILAGLKDKNEDSRIKGAFQLGNYVEKAAKELSGENFSSFIEKLTEKHIQELVNSKESYERLGGILAIDKLVDLNYDDPKKITLCSNYLRNTLTSYGDSITVTLVAKTLGKLAKASASTSSKTLTAEWVEFEIRRALEWLEGYMEKKRDKEDEKRYASLLVITELAKSAPTLFYAHVSMFFQHIWKGISDLNPITRQASINALRAVLALVSERSTSGRVEWYHDILSRVKTELASKKDDKIHGALLVVGELLRNTGSFMLNFYDETCEQILQFSGSSNALIRTAVIGLIPQFARFNTKLFTERKSESKSEGYLYRSVAIILSDLKANPSKDERSQAYMSLGEVAIQVGTKSILKYNYSIIQVIKEGLNPIGSKKPFVREALKCCAMLARASGKEVGEYIEGLLDSMFGEGLTSVLTESFSEIVEAIPNLLIGKESIQFSIQTILESD